VGRAGEYVTAQGFILSLVLTNLILTNNKLAISTEAQMYPQG
jgi:hypothetical protein